MNESLIIALGIICLVIDLMITATRTGLINIRYAQLLAKAERGEEAATQILELMENRTKFSTSFKLGQAFLRAFMIGMVLILFLPFESLENRAWLLILILIGLGLVIWLLEFFVETAISREPEAWAVRLTPVARAIALLLTPFTALPLRLVEERGPHQNHTEAPTEDEILTLMNASQRDGLLEVEERKMIHSIFQMGETLAREIMIPRMDMFTLDVESILEDVADEILESGFSRVPVFDGQIDNIIGMLYTKDILKAWKNNEIRTSLRTLLRPANFIPEAKKIDELLGEMQNHRIHIAIVVDEYGGVAGLVTLEDIVEEIFGEILDEYDLREELPYEQLSESEYLLRGRIDLDDFNELMGVNLEDDDAETLGGFIYSTTGKVPKVGEKIDLGEITLTVEKISGRRIRKVRATRTVVLHTQAKDHKSDTLTLEEE